MSSWPCIVLLLAMRCLYQGGTSDPDRSQCELLKIEHEMYLDWSFCFSCYCCWCVIILLLFLFICHCASTVTDEQQNYLVKTTRMTTTTTTTTTRSIYINCSIFLFWLFLLLLCNLLLFLFTCSCGSTITDEQQQQNETVTKTTTKQINLHKLFSVQELISHINIPIYNLPLPELNMKWAKEWKVNLTWHSTALDHLMPLLGGTSDCPLPSQLHSSECQADLM